MSHYRAMMCQCESIWQKSGFAKQSSVGLYVVLACSRVANRDMGQKHYLQTANDEAGVSIYKHQIDEMTRDNKQSLEVSYVGLSRMDPDLAAILADGPKDVLEAMSEVAKEVVALQYPDYSLICDEIFVRIVHLPIKYAGCDDCAWPPCIDLLMQ